MSEEGTHRIFANHLYHIDEAEKGKIILCHSMVAEMFCQMLCNFYMGNGGVMINEKNHSGKSRKISLFKLISSLPCKR